MTCPLALVLGRVRIVLKDTTHPGNIGASARAMKTMGLTRLVLASPRTLLDSRSRAMAAGAADILAEMEVHDGLDGALTGAACVFGFTARRRSDGDAPLSACAAGAEAARRIRRGAEAVFLFGGERSGLSNEDVARCRYTVEIPANPDYSSLNLAQAVQVAGYELRRALLAESDETEGGGGGDGAGVGRIRTPAGEEHLAGLMRHARTALRKIGLPKHPDGPPVLPRLRRFILRAEPDESEVNMLRGILRAAEAAADKKPSGDPSGEN